MSFQRDGVVVTVDAAGVAELRLDRPTTGNAIDLSLAAALADALECLSASAAVRAVEEAHRGVMALATLRKPVVVAVTGAAAAPQPSLGETPWLVRRPIASSTWASIERIDAFAWKRSGPSRS